VLRKLGRAEQASQVALARRELWSRDPQHLLAVAEELALASNLPSESPGESAIQQQSATWAVETLQQAVAAGLALPLDLENQGAFAAIKDDKGFLELVGKQ
jgi:hypothetical protein